MSHAPYIMPDGRPLDQYLLHEKRGSEGLQRGSRRQGRSRGKDQAWQQLQAHASRKNITDWEAAELQILQVVGHRRRRRWLNDKVLRDMAGPMTAADMEDQFKPVPFGMPSRSKLSEALEQVGQPVWDRLRNISWDKQSAVLQRWEEHVSGGRGAQHAKVGSSAAATALQRWAQVERKARTALRHANPHSVMELEAPILEFVHVQGELAQSLVLQPPDSFARLLAHGLAAFHGLRSCSLPGTQPDAPRQVLLTWPPPPQPPLPASDAAAASPAQATDGGAAGGPLSGLWAEVTPAAAGDAAAGGSPAAGAPQRATTPSRPAGGSRSTTPCRASGDGSRPAGLAADEVHGLEELTCTDVLMAAQELGPAAGLSVHSLERYIRAHLHGIEDEREARGRPAFMACL